MQQSLIIVIVLLLIITFYFSKPLFFIVLAGSAALLIAPKFIGGNIDQHNYKPVNIDGKFDYLAGPVSFTIMKGDKNIILCGDVHTYENIICNKEVYLPDYLEWLFQINSGEIFDIFMETFYNNDKKIDLSIKSNSGLFTNVDEKFGKCFKNLFKKNWCAQNYPNVRFHVSDYRRHYENSKNNIETVLSKYMEFRYYLFKHIDLLIEYFNMNNSVDNLMKHLFELSRINIYDTVILIDNTEIFIKKFCDDLLTDPKLKRNFNATGDMQPHILNYVKNNINDFLQDKTESLNYLINMFKTKKNENNEKNMKLFENAMNNLYLLFTRLGVLIMDFYLLCRMFKKFNIEKESYITEPETKNVIIIAGDAHIRTYKKFLTSVGYKIEFETVTNEKKCLDVKQMPNTINDIILKN